jgi:nucleoside-diphosphate-sugar epimerase
MRLLILGGTVFLGRAVARHARDAGIEVTCATRGTSGAPVDGVRWRRVDRDEPGGLAALDGERFDAVVDVARRPSQVRSAVAALADRVGHWVYVSSCSAYADQATPGQVAGSAPLLPAAPPEMDSGEGEEYGRGKVACEEAVVAAVGADRAFVCRAGLIVGPEDPTGRFSYWVDRLARGGEVLAPGDPADPVQFVDVRDLAAWLVHAAQAGLSGPYDGIGAPMSRADFLGAVAHGVGTTSTLTWVSQDFLLDHGVRPWFGDRSLPLWLPLPEYGGFLGRDVSASLAAGLHTRPVADTARDTMRWLADRGGPDASCGLAPGEEADLLSAWHAADGPGGTALRG